MAYVPNSGSVAAWLQSDNASVITVSQGSVAVAIVSGSIAATFTPPANQSVSGTVQADVRGSVATVIIGGSISATFTPPANQSVSGAVTAPPGSLLSVTNPAGSVTAVLATQVTSPWIVAPNNSSLFAVPVGSYVTLQPAGSIMAVSGAVTAPAGSVMNTVSPAGSITAVSATIVAGSITSVTNPAGSVTTVIGTITANAGTVPGSVVAFQGTSPWLTNQGGSVITVWKDSSVVAYQLAGSILATSATVLPGSVSGAITAPPGSIMSVANPAGSVTTVNFQNSSILTIPANTSVITILQAPSIVGTYGEDVPSTAADKGIFTLGIRNDTVASLVGADLDYTGWSTDSAGRHLTKPFAAEEARLTFNGSVVSGSVTAIFNSVVGLRNYVTDFFVANTGTATTLLTFKDGSTSVLGYAVVPAGGGFSAPGLNMPIRSFPSQDLAYSVSPSTSVLYLTVQGYKAP